jgi:HAE1 family hydrophobic/amphiphilic exporter-1
VSLVLAIWMVAAAPAPAGAAPAQDPAPAAPITPAPRVGVAGPVLALTLGDAIRMALEQNGDVAIARLDAGAAAEGIRAAEGAYDLRLMPALSFTRAVSASASAIGGAVRGRVEQRVVTGSAQIAGRTPWAGGQFAIDISSTRQATSNQFARLNPQFPSALGVSYTQPLFRGRRIDAERRAILVARRALDLTEAQLAQTLMDQLMLVEQAYWELVFAVRNLDVQATALAQAQGQVASNERQAREGTLSPIDVVEAQTQVATFRQTVASAQQTLTEAENRLKALMLTSRESPAWNQPLVPADPVDRDAPDRPLAEAVQLALSRRPELTALDAVRAQNDADRRFFDDLGRPQVDLVGGVTVAGLAGGALADTDESIPDFLIGGYGSSIGNLFARRFPTAVVQVQMEWPLGRTTARANIARSELAGATIARQRLQLEQAIDAEVRNTMQAVQSARERLAGAASASRNAREQYDSEWRRFESGLSTVFLVLERQTNLVSAQARELRARADLNQAIALLDRAVGGTLERHGVAMTASRH